MTVQASGGASPAVLADLGARGAALILDLDRSYVGGMCRE